MEALSERLLNVANPWLRENGPEVNGQPCPLFHQPPSTQGIRWGSMPGFQPFAEVISSEDTAFLVAGFLPLSHANDSSGFNAEPIRLMSSQTNLLYFDWEDTSARLSDWMPLLQTLRALTGHSPMPEDCPSLRWLESMKLRLGPTKTTISLTSSNRLSLHRESSIGFSAVELHLFADWIESPEFPRGLHTFGNTAAGATRP